MSPQSKVMDVSKTSIDGGDHYNKSGEKVKPLSTQTNHDKNFVMVPTHVFRFACFVLATFVVITQMGVFSDNVNYERFVALQLEILGLVMLRAKIHAQKTVSGISEATFLMYAAVYFGRFCSSVPLWGEDEISLDFILGFFSFLLVLDIVKAIFVTYRSTYDAELDQCRVWYLLPACWALALVVQVQFEEWTFFGRYSFTCLLYMDVLALMPQVVMMAMAGGKVTTPVANFVATTAISRCGDLSHTFLTARKQYLELGEDRFPITLETIPYFFNLSAWLVILLQFIHLLLVADFMYYYCKSRTSAEKENEEIDLWV